MAYHHPLCSITDRCQGGCWDAFGDEYPARYVALPAHRKELDLDLLRQETIEDLIARGHSREEISRMTPEEAFSEWCNWNGLIGFGPTIWNVINNLKEANK
jgi:hypothetical protein